MDNRLQQHAETYQSCHKHWPICAVHTVIHNTLISECMLHTHMYIYIFVHYIVINIKTHIHAMLVEQK